MAIRKKRAPLPLRKIAPNMVTSGNLLCGMMALVLLFHGRPVPAGWLVFAAVFFDFMDGKVARSLGGGTQFGLEFDSLADMVSFGVVPAMLVYTTYTHPLGLWAALGAAFFALCGALRLARFNVVHVPGPFEGLPIPAGGLFLASFVIAGIPLYPLGALVISLGAGVLMISSVPYGNLKGLQKGRGDLKKILLLGGVVAITYIALHSASLPAVMGIYVASGLLRFDWEKWLAKARDDEEAPGKKI